MKKIRDNLKLKKGCVILLLILVVGFVLRIYQPAQLFMYGHDQDLAGWFVKDVVVNKHLRLIGQETSTQGIFIGPIYYYMLIPFYLLFEMDPIGGVLLVTLLGMLSIVSVYYVFTQVYGKKEGLIASFVYAVSFYTVFNDREVVPTMPVIVWTIWFFYGLDLLLKGKQKKGFAVLGILVGLIWHLNMALVLLLPLILLSLYLSKEKLDFKKLYSGLVYAGVLLLPLALFEIRHGFSQTKWFIKSLTTHQYAVISGYEQFMRVIHLLSKNASAFVWGSFDSLSYETTLILFAAVFVFLVSVKKIKKPHAYLLISWILLYVGFFTMYSKNISEYYLNGTILVWIVIFTLGISHLISQKDMKIAGRVVIFVFLFLNIDKFARLEVNKISYLERRATVAEIKRDAGTRGYPCVSVSYITNPGYDLGYRYFFFLEDMHVNRPKSKSPVYTIVFPLRDDIKVDRTFGAIGLIYPDYDIYSPEGVKISCSGENENLTEPLWGFTQ